MWSKYTFQTPPFMSSNSNSIEGCEWYKSVTHISAPECATASSFFFLPAGASSSASPPLWFPPLFQIHIIDFDDENNIINKTVLLHQAGEIWHIGASPADKAVLTTCYNKSESHCFLLSPTPLASSLGVMLLYFAPLFSIAFVPHHHQHHHHHHQYRLVTFI